MKKYPGLAQELQLKKRSPLPLAVKKPQLLVKPDEYQSSQFQSSSCASCSSRRKMLVSTLASTVSVRSCSTAASPHSLTLFKAFRHWWACSCNVCSEPQTVAFRRLAQSGGKTTLGSTPQSKSGLPVAQLPGKSAQPELGFVVNVDGGGWPPPPPSTV